MKRKSKKKKNKKYQGGSLMKSFTLEDTHSKMRKARLSRYHSEDKDWKKTRVGEKTLASGKVKRIHNL